MIIRDDRSVRVILGRNVFRRLGGNGVSWIILAVLTAAVEPPGQEGKCHRRAGKYDQHQVRTQFREPPHMISKLGPVFPGPPLPVARLHQQGHEPFNLDGFAEQALAFALLDAPHVMKGAEEA
jgi:hypothetical protein